MLCNKNYHIAVGQLYFKNKQTNKLIEKEIRFVVTTGKGWREKEMDYNINEDKDIINNMINMINTALCYIYIYWYYSKFLSVLTKKKNLDTDTANETEKQACIANKQKTKIQTQQSVSRAHSLPAACQ